MTGKIAVGGITRVDDLVMVKILGAQVGQGFAGRALSGLGGKGISVSCVTSFSDGRGLNNISFAIRSADLDQTLGILQSMQEELEVGKIDYTRGCAAISVYGPHFSERPAIAGTVFETISDAGMEILLITTSFSTVTFLTYAKEAELAVERLGEKFLVP